jgi:cobalt-zinc-cadmium resistance protein CzcA
MLANVNGIEDLGMLSSLGQPSVTITPNRWACARYGLNSGDVVAVVQAAIGGQTVTEVFEREKSFALTVRWLPPYRSSLEAIREIQLATPSNLMVPLGQVAAVELVEGPSTIYREDGQRYTPIKFSVRGRDLESTIEETQKSVTAKLPQGYGQHLEWSGQITELRAAQRRLLIIVPLTVLIIALLVYAAVRTWLATVIVLIDLPIACTGGLIALLVTGTHFSVSAAMGFLSIFGVAIQDAILVVTYFQRQRYFERKPIPEAARDAAIQRFRPALMTTLVATLGLLPAALSRGIGAQAQKPLAIAVIGGAIIIAVLTRFVQPPLLVIAHDWWEKRRIRKGRNPNPFVVDDESGDAGAERQTT